ncbi:hypothetical protein CDAR_218791 [Caerostris darwini]|uniref:Uncharacterized protein n=1 Tax=Caerostris darwini TaxID=1538125 RepID=A0AAV4UG33_9ARAC|nr:hypothetical protein CDAR_218791 [Caerostris darwini]
MGENQHDRPLLQCEFESTRVSHIDILNSDDGQPCCREKSIPTRAKDSKTEQKPRVLIFLLNFGKAHAPQLVSVSTSFCCSCSGENIEKAQRIVVTIEVRCHCDKDYESRADCSNALNPVSLINRHILTKTNQTREPIEQIVNMSSRD